MESKIKHCIINASNGNGWYPRGTARLKRSLIEHGFNGDILTWYDWPNDNLDKTTPYNVKVCAFEEAIKLGYTHILWLDCSVWAIGDPNKLFDVINEHGYYFWPSGYNCAQVCSDKCLDYFGVNRDIAEGYSDCSTSMFGVNLDNPIAKEFIERWIKSAYDGAFKGSRNHDNQSKDKRFMFHRQDQSCASIILNQLEMKITPANIYSSYYSPQQNESIIFTMRKI
jgi:hypothetical protein